MFWITNLKILTICINLCSFLLISDVNPLTGWLNFTPCHILSALLCMFFLNSWLHVLPMHNMYVLFILFLWQYNITISYSSIAPLLYSINKYIHHSFIQWNLFINRISLCTCLLTESPCVWNKLVFGLYRQINKYFLHWNFI